MKRLMLWAAAIAVAGVAAACGDSVNSPGSLPSGQSGNGNATNTASAAAQAQVASACGFSRDGDTVIVNGPGGPPSGDPSTSTGGQSGGADPNSPPPAGAEVMLLGPVSSVTGTCPALTLTLNHASVRTTAATSFPSGSCDAIRHSANIGTVGTAQADGSISARCVTGF